MIPVLESIQGLYKSMKYFEGIIDNALKHYTVQDSERPLVIELGAVAQPIVQQKLKDMYGQAVDGFYWELKFQPRSNPIMMTVQIMWRKEKKECQELG